MFDPLLTLIAAKTKAVGLVAGTAMVTTALVGGGAVAMTAVSDSDPLASETTVEQVVEAPAAELEAVEGEQALEPVEAVVSDTPTVGIDEPEKVRPPLPDDFTCDDSLNHGQNVSAYARSLEKGPGRGAKVSAVAQSDCGKKAEEADATEVEAASVEAEESEEAEEAEESEEAEVEEAEEPKPAKAEKAPKAAKSSGKASGKGGGKSKK